jgi:hypothetical protein
MNRLPSTFLPRSFCLPLRTSHGLAVQNYLPKRVFSVDGLCVDHPPDLAGLLSFNVNSNVGITFAREKPEKPLQSPTNLPSERRAIHHGQGTINEEHLTSSAQSFAFTSHKLVGETVAETNGRQELWQW